MSENIYKTSNLCLAGYFAHEGIMPHDLQQTGQMRSRPGSSVYTFCYDEDIDKLKELEKLYFTNKAKVDPKKYEYEKKTLKEIIDNTGKNNNEG